MKPIVLYHTNYNTTKMAAEAIAGHFKINDIYNINEFNLDKISDYDTIFLGSNIRAFQIGKPIQNLLKMVKKSDSNQKVFLFLCCGTPDPVGIEKAKGLKTKYPNIQDFGVFGGRMTFADLTDDDKEMIRVGYELMKREIEDYDDYKEQDVINFCKKIENKIK
ncbi:MAG: hypothetical protein EAX96_04630 [Candidatus Lokiarchaeota archaeon]|nr:hypothetical protein [Candidatus Lokiarchaeota archaeon]